MARKFIKEMTTQGEERTKTKLSFRKFLKKIEKSIDLAI